MWTLKKKYKTPYKQKVKGIINIFAVRDIYTGKRYYRFYDWKNSYIVIDFVEWLLRDVFPDKEIYLKLDGWSAHRSAAFKAYADLQPRLHLVPLPKCASWLNEIESDFARVQKELLDNGNFSSVEELIKRISAFFDYVLNST